MSRTGELPFGTATRCYAYSAAVGFAIVAAEGYETIDGVVLAEPSDMISLGVRRLEGLGVSSTASRTASARAGDRCDRGLRRRQPFPGVGHQGIRRLRAVAQRDVSLEALAGVGGEADSFLRPRVPV